MIVGKMVPTIRFGGFPIKVCSGVLRVALGHPSCWKRSAGPSDFAF